MNLRFPVARLGFQFVGNDYSVRITASEEDELLPGELSMTNPAKEFIGRPLVGDAVSFCFAEAEMGLSIVELSLRDFAPTAERMSVDEWLHLVSKSGYFVQLDGLMAQALARIPRIHPGSYIGMEPFRTWRGHRVVLKLRYDPASGRRVLATSPGFNGLRHKAHFVHPGQRWLFGLPQGVRVII